jgi:hypothetical protein
MNNKHSPLSCACTQHNSTSMVNHVDIYNLCIIWAAVKINCLRLVKK